MVINTDTNVVTKDAAKSSAPTHPGLIREWSNKFTLILIWFSLPMCLLLQVPVKYSIFFAIFTGFTFLTHCFHVLMFRHLLPPEKRAYGMLMLFLFGPVEVEKLQKLANAANEVA